jgi:hypothetical protein
LSSRSCERDALFVGQLLEASISVDMQDALEGSKMCDRSLRLVIRSEQVDGRWRFRSAAGPLLAGVHQSRPVLVLTCP